MIEKFGIGIDISNIENLSENCATSCCDIVTAVEPALFFLLNLSSLKLILLIFFYEYSLPTKL